MSQALTASPETKLQPRKGVNPKPKPEKAKLSANKPSTTASMKVASRKLERHSTKKDLAELPTQCRGSEAAAYASFNDDFFGGGEPRCSVPYH